ncbi:pseudouridine synthase [Cyclobacterium salsum]|uniref:pseudouridine synthase n=1 Tax=Cyclobacterium salsum TaxID=2666329 RepID=UPI001391E0AB|nr:pseudouridine synthase [Cyclobacterium salsum]
MRQLPLLYEDNDYLAVNKPVGVLVHKTPLERSPDALFAVDLLHKQVGYKVYPLHRIDRPTSGVLLFAKNAAAASRLQPEFAGTSINKEYLAIVRGYMPQPHALIDQPLAKDLEFELQEALTEYWTLAQTEIPYPSSNRYASSRYSLVKIYPHTGRMHQIRRHFAHIRHYIIGDKTHGDNKQNKFFDRHFQMRFMLLHAWKLAFNHPESNEKITIQAPAPTHFQEMSQKLGWEPREFFP